jgi:nicotinamidase/pyrazinamidase
MTRLIFWDVDTQHDFMRSDGLLYVPGSEEIAATLGALTAYAHTHGIRIVASADDHVPGHRELSDTPDFLTTFPLHCMRGTPGQLKISETALRDPCVIQPERQGAAELSRRLAAHHGDVLLLKHWFDVFTNENIETVLGILAPMSVVLYGVAQDVCDKYAIEGLLRHYSQLRLYAVSDAMKPIDRDMAQRLLDQWAQQGVRIVKTSEIVEGGLLDSLLAA